jgi:hypothetical protein
MAKRVNYGRDKRKKEIDRLKKREEKLERKRAKKRENAEGEPVEGEEAEIEAGVDDTGPGSVAG